MTKADPAGEPSMEDILASIRKIIAEEPPGSRPMPEPRQPEAAAPQPYRAFTRQSEPEPQPQHPAAPAPEPYLRPQAGSASNPFPAFSSASIPDRPFASRQEPAFAPEAAAVAPVFAPGPVAFAVAPAFAPEPANPLPGFASGPAALAPVRAPSVDDQLSDLLGAAPAAMAPAPEPPPRRISVATDFIARMTTPAAAAPAPAAPAPEFQVAVQPELTALQSSEPRPGFTVSRAGYVPEAEPLHVPEAEPVATKREAFAFDLGPHPFAAKTQPAEPVFTAREELGPAPKARGTETDLGSFVPVRYSHTAPEATVATAAQVEAAAEPVPASPQPVAEAVATPAPEPVPTVESILETLRAPLHEPVVAAEPAEPAGLVAASEPAAPQQTLREETLTVIADEVPDAKATAVAIFEPEPQAWEAPGAVIDVTPPAESQPSLAADVTASMEDTVAELLRPMLKSWLTENMPKIVERALRKEIAERNLIEHKSAAE